MSVLINFLYDESGATAVEYGLIATFVSIAAIFAMSILGTSLSDISTLVSGFLDDVLAAVGMT